MGEAKRRERALAAGIAVATRPRINPRIERSIDQSRAIFSLILHDADLVQARAKAPLLAEMWFRIIGFAELAKEGNITPKDVRDFWRSYWDYDIVNALGQVDIRLDENWYFMTRIKGAALLATEYIAVALMGRCNPDILEKACAQQISIGESTLEIGLAAHVNCIIYWGENLVIHKGFDTDELPGEIMIAVRHSSGCWNYYPSPNNYRVSLSDYRRARWALSQYPLPIKGELMHSQSGKIARLLGMEVEGNYAYLIR